MNLKERRTQIGLTLEEVGDLVGVGKSTVRKWENGDINNIGRQNISRLAQALKISPLHIIKDDYSDIEHDIFTIYEQLEQTNKNKVRSYAEKVLDEQNQVIEIKPTVYVVSKLSAGSGIIDLDPTDTEEVEFDGYIPAHDLAFEVTGDSMVPMFKDGEIVFVEKTQDIRSGQIIAVQINEEAYIKKAYIEDKQLRLVSLNKDYDDIYADGTDDIRVVGRVVL